MKEITAYQSDDGKFVGTYEEVLEYENNYSVLMENIVDRFSYTNHTHGFSFAVALDYRLDIKAFLQHPHVKDLFHLLNG